MGGAPKGPMANQFARRCIFPRGAKNGVAAQFSRRYSSYKSFTRHQKAIFSGSLQVRARLSAILREAGTGVESTTL
jgi:hypothetical protein